MKTRPRFTRLAAILAVAVSTVLGNEASIAADDPGGTRIARSIVAERIGVGASALELLVSRSGRTPVRAESIRGFKFLNRADGTLHRVTIDATGSEIRDRDIAEQERRERLDRFGILEPDLFERLLTASDEEVMGVVLRLADPLGEAGVRPRDPSLPRKLGRATAERRYRRIYRERRARVRERVEPVASRLVAGGCDAAASTFVPIVFARMTPEEIVRVSEWRGIEAIHLARSFAPELDVARKTTNGHFLEVYGNTGLGQRVALIDVGGRVAATNPYLQGVTQNPLWVSPTPDFHTTAMAGILRSTDLSVRGMAPDLELWAGGSARGDMIELAFSTEFALQWGTHVLNLSWGWNTGANPMVMDFYQDYVAYWYDRTIVASAGNEGSYCNSRTGNVTSPGLAFNVITVGAFDDKDTVTWNDDSMNPCSSSRVLSTYADRQKPELAAPGSGIRTTSHLAPWLDGLVSGTSASAAFVSGTAALMGDNSWIHLSPEAVKAVLMATAIHNIEGDSRLSRLDGAGGLDAFRAADLAKVGIIGGIGEVPPGGAWGFDAYGCEAREQELLISAQLAAGRRCRVAVVWPENPASSNPAYPSTVYMDLDIKIQAPDGSTVAGSYSFDNNFEIVDFIAPQEGRYWLVARRYDDFCDAYVPDEIAWAWYMM